MLQSVCVADQNWSVVDRTNLIVVFIGNKKTQYNDILYK